MKINIVAKTGLDNVFQITGDQSGFAMTQTKSSQGDAVGNTTYRGNKLHFSNGKIVLQEGSHVAAETFGIAEITEIRIS